MMRRWALWILLGLCVGAWEMMVYPFLPTWLAWRPLLPIAVLLLLVHGRGAALACVLAGSVILDTYQVAFSDLAFFRYALVIVMLNFFLRQWLTNRSLYTALGLMVIGRAVERGLAWAVGTFTQVIGATAYGWMHGPHEVAAFLWDMLWVAAGFIILFSSRRFLSFGAFESSARHDTYGIR